MASSVGAGCAQPVGLPGRSSPLQRGGDRRQVCALALACGQRYPHSTADRQGGRLQADAQPDVAWRSPGRNSGGLWRQGRRRRRFGRSRNWASEREVPVGTCCRDLVDLPSQHKPHSMGLKRPWPVHLPHAPPNPSTTGCEPHEEPGAYN